MVLSPPPSAPSPIRGRTTRRPATLQEQLQARESGVVLDPRTGRVLGAIQSLEDAETKRRVRQDQLFAQAIGGEARQLGLGIPTSEGSTFLRPEQIGALLALRRGDNPLPVLSSLGGQEIKSGPLPSRSFGQASAFDFTGGGGAVVPFASSAGGPAPPSTSSSRMPLLLAAAAAAALLFFARRKP